MVLVLLLFIQVLMLVRKNGLSSVTVIVLLWLGFITQLHANEAEFNWQLDLGVSLQHRTNIVDSLDANDDELSGGILVSGGLYYDNFFIETSPFRTQPLTFGYRVNQTRSTQVNLVGMSWFSSISERDQVQGDRLNGVNKRRQSFEVGVEYLKQFKRSDLRIGFLHDSLNRHQGYIVSVDHSRPIYKTNWLIIPSWGLTYLSENVVDYYYGISSDEVRLSRAEYQGEAGWTLTGRVYVEHPLGKNKTLFAFVSYSKLSKSITDSPIVSANEATHTAAIGVLWSF